MNNESINPTNQADLAKLFDYPQGSEVRIVAQDGRVVLRTLILRDTGGELTRLPTLE
jgi:hypothetical protein